MITRDPRPECAKQWCRKPVADGSAFCREHGAALPFSGQDERDALRGAAPPLDAPEPNVTRRGSFVSTADLESLRADRALLARYGAVLALPYLPAHAQAYCEALNAVWAELGERALALAAQGRGKGEGR